MIQDAIQKAVNGSDLTLSETKEAMSQIMSGEATPAQIGAFLTAMRIKGETIDEITACAAVMRDKAERVNVNDDVIDIVGTGGDCANSFNVSTVSAVVAAAGGVKVAKHGNRSVSSKCGSADVLDALGVKIDLEPKKAEALLKDTGICFMFAQVYHKSMKYAAGPRKELGMRTIFNILGPLSNPAFANLQLLGVYDEKLVRPLAEVLKNLGVKRAMVVYGKDGLDEISISSETAVCELRDGELSEYTICPDDCGLNLYSKSDIVGGGAAENAGIARRILSGEKGPKREMVLINAGAALYIAGIAKSIKEGVKTAAGLIDSGRANEKLEQFIAVSNSL